MRAIVVTGRVLVAVACTMMASCERLEGERSTQRTARQEMGGCGTPVNCGDATNLTTTAVTAVKLESNFVMIPRTRWDQLIAEANGDLGALQATNQVREKAVQAASIANDPMASGVFSTDPAPLTEGGSFTVNDILVVVEDADVRLDPRSDKIYATNYFIAAVGLSGSSSWMRRGLAIAVEPTMMSGGGRCCGPENVGEQHEPTLGGPGTQPPECSPGPYAYCSGWNTRLRVAGSLNHDQRRSQSGRPIIMMRMFSLSGQAMRFSFAGRLGGLAPGAIDCTQALPMCLEPPGTTGFPWGGWEADLPHGNSACAPSGRFGGTNVPPWCTIASGSNYSASGSSLVVVRPSGGGLGLASCDGQCPECSSLDAVSNTGVIPRQCWLRTTMTGDICEKDSAAKMKQLQDEMNARLDYATMTPCATPQDLTARCGGCRAVGNAGLYECGRCTKNVSTAVINCDYYQSYENGAPACPQEADLICRPEVRDTAPVGEVQGSYAKSFSGGGPPTTLAQVSLLPDLPCTVGCGGASRVNEHMPSAAPRGGAVAETAGEAPKNVNAAERSDKKEGENSEIPNDGQKNASDQPKADGDPVTLFDGALVLNTSDLSFPGPSRPLEFARSYNSRTNIRSPLGSNWSHSFAARLIPLKKQNMPAWVDPYCMGTPTVTTCVMLVSGDSSRIFYLDQATGMYMPQAGSMATVRAVSDNPANGTDDIGWILRQPDGSQLTFDLRGYLRLDVDRFGNGFTVEYELTAAGRAMEAVCPQVPFVRVNGEWGAVLGPTGVSSEMQGCVLLYGLTGFSDMPTFSSTTVVTDAMFGSPSTAPAATAARAAVVASQPTFGTPLPSGQAHQRVKRVTDELGRTLDFEYFTSGVNNGLLQRVRGPAATAVEFTYASNASAPAGLNERFLVAAKRVDGSAGLPLIQAAGNRGYEYQYAWQRSDQMPTDLTTAGAAYRAYFGNIYNCGGLVKQSCSDKWINTVQFADTGALAAEQLRRLYAEAADNITTVRVHSYAPTTSRIESETRYARNVYDSNFDRAMAQRWGGEVDPALPAVQHPPTSFTWQTSLPLATFEYAGAVPKASGGTVIGDETDDFLPVALRTRYAMEPDLWPSSSGQSSYDKGLLLPRSPPVTPPAPFAGGRVPVALGVSQILENTVRQPCGYHLLPDARTKLPGYKPSLDYYDTQLPTGELATPGVSFTQQIRRSYLSCETLALAETYDVRHNDLASTWTKATNGSFVVESMTGRRKHTAANANRICQWVRYTDRDGDVHYTGLNFQGRPLVNAVQVVAGNPGHLKVAETLYNADGNVLSQRRTTGAGWGGGPWTPSAGDTRYTYMETGVPSGSLGTTRPQHWTKRGNVVRVWERPRGDKVVDEVDGTSTLVTSLGRFTDYAYEPFFNQVRLVVRGNVKNDMTYEALERTVMLQDWQEFGSSDPQLQRMLWMAHLWGGQLSTDSPPGSPRQLPTDGGTFSFDWEAVKGQLNVALYAADLNDDGVYGSTTGVPVLIRAEAGLGWAQHEDTQLRWSPAGRPYIIDAPGGARTVLEYYARAGAQSGAADLTSSGAINGGNAGFLARVTREREWPKYAGPPRASCEELPSQYRFLLPSCAKSPQGQLSALGLSAEAVDGIVNAPSGFTTGVNYNVLGHVSGVRNYAGLRSVITTDTDGRTLQTDVYPAGSSARDTYSVETLDAFKRVTRSERFANSGQVLSDTQRTFDNGDQLLTQCHASEANGCAVGQTANVKRRWVYTREGAVFRSIDAAGLVAENTRDPRKWVTVRRLTSPDPSDEERIEATEYDDDGRVVLTMRGNQSRLTEQRKWDGLGRLVYFVDAQDRVVKYQYSKQGALTSSELVGDTAGRATYAHDGFGRTSIASKNGRTLAVYNRIPGGLPFAVSADGRGTQFVTYDALGKVAWTENSVGDMSVFTETVSPNHVMTSSLIRQQGRLTTGSVSSMDALGRIISTREVGGALRRETLFKYDVAGNLDQTKTPDTATTRAVYDLLGRMKELHQQQAWNTAVYEVSTYTYNSRGFLESIFDPMGYETVQQYDGFGAPSAKTGPQSILDEWKYDEHGRKVTHTVNGQIDLGYRYDSFGRLAQVTRGDPANPGVPELASFEYDALGRVESAKRRNLGLSPYLAEADRTVTLGRTYDDASRRYTETVTVGQGPPRTLTTEWAFTGAWARAVTLPSGRTQEHRFDTEGRESQQLRASGELSDFYWLNELLEGSTSNFPGHNPVMSETQFDALGQPVAWNWFADDRLMNVSVVRDNMGRIASSGIDFSTPAQTATSWRGYVYDALGRIAIVREGAATPSGVQPHEATPKAGAEVEAAGNSVSAARWVYTREEKIGGLLSIDDGNHRQRFETPLKFTSPNGTDTARTAGHRLDLFVVGNSTRQAAYDGAGRLVGDDDQQFVFDDLDALAFVRDPGGNLTEGYLYDAQGRLTARLDAAAQVVESIVHDGVQMVESFDSGGAVRWSASWGPGIDNLVSLTTQNYEYFTLADGKANIVGWVSNQSGQLEAFAEYTPEGRGKYTDDLNGTVCEEVDSVRCAKPFDLPFGFHSAYSSSATGLIYFRNRWYSPEAAQWLSHDPLGFVDSFNLYAFNAFDSVNFFDPMGLDSNLTDDASDPEIDPALPYGPCSGADPKCPRNNGSSPALVSSEAAPACNAVCKLMEFGGREFQGGNSAGDERRSGRSGTPTDRPPVGRPPSARPPAPMPSRLPPGSPGVRPGAAALIAIGITVCAHFQGCSDAIPVVRYLTQPMSETVVEIRERMGGDSPVPGTPAPATPETTPETRAPDPEPATDGAGALQPPNRPKFNFKRPANRHSLRGVDQRSVAKDVNSVMEPDINVNADVAAINEGNAERTGESFLLSNGRTYGVHNGTLFPISGPGIHQLNRGAYQALGVLNKFGDTPQAHGILGKMGNVGPPEVEAALKAWRSVQ